MLLVEEAKNLINQFVDILIAPSLDDRHKVIDRLHQAISQDNDSISSQDLQPLIDKLKHACSMDITKSVHIECFKNIIIEKGGNLKVGDVDIALLKFIQNAALIAHQPIPDETFKNHLAKIYAEYQDLPRLFSELKTPIQNSFVNIALVPKKDIQLKEQQLGNAAVANFEALYDAAFESLELSQLFERLPNDKVKTPIRKILIWGRAGIGKTVLCQYLATQWANGVLLRPFKAVFWLRLRDIAADFPSLPGEQKTSEELLLAILKKYFFSSFFSLLTQPEAIAQKQEALRTWLIDHQNECLFILDGFDQFVAQLSTTPKHLTGVLDLLRQWPLFLTSRPVDLDHFGNHPIAFDRELECMGFTNENIPPFIHIYLAAAEKIQEKAELTSFLQAFPNLWETAHVPLSLELICWSWCQGKFTPLTSQYLTLTRFYGDILQRLKKVATDKFPSLKKEYGVTPLINLVYTFLNVLAHKGLEKNNILFPGWFLREAIRFFLMDQNISHLALEPEDLLKACNEFGVLKTTGIGGKQLLDQTHYFVHLSFQEFMSAQYCSQQISVLSVPMGIYLKNNKYSLPLQLMWRFTAGLLYEESQLPKGKLQGLAQFFNILLTEPKDLLGSYHLAFLAYCLEECAADTRLSFIVKLLEQQAIYLKAWFFILPSTHLWLKTLQHCSLVLLSDPTSRVIETFLEGEEKEKVVSMLFLVGMLGHLRENWFHTLARALYDQKIDPSKREEIAFRLAQRPDLPAWLLNALTLAITDSHIESRIRGSIASGLTRRPDLSTFSLPESVEQTLDKSYLLKRVRVKIASHLAQHPSLPASILDALERTMYNSEVIQVRCCIAYGLARRSDLPPPKLETLYLALNHPEVDSRVKRSIVYGFAQRHDLSSLQLTALEELIHNSHTDKRLREEIAFSASQCVDLPTPFFNTLEQTIHDPDLSSGIRCYIASRLAQHPTLPTALSSALEKIIHDPSPIYHDVRCCFARSLARRPDLPVPLLNVLIEAINNSEIDSRLRGQITYGLIQRPILSNIQLTALMKTLGNPEIHKSVKKEIASNLIQRPNLSADQANAVRAMLDSDGNREEEEHTPPIGYSPHRPKKHDVQLTDLGQRFTASDINDINCLIKIYLSLLQNGWLASGQQKVKGQYEVVFTRATEKNLSFSLTSNTFKEAAKQLGYPLNLYEVDKIELSDENVVNREQTPDQTSAQQLPKAGIFKSSRSNTIEILSKLEIAENLLNQIFPEAESLVLRKRLREAYQQEIQRLSEKKIYTEADINDINRLLEELRARQPVSQQLPNLIYI